MAGSVRCFMKLNLGLLSKNVTRHIVLNQTRTLFSQQTLGLTMYLKTRNNYKNQFLNLEDSFRSKMKNYVESNESGMIFTEDLKVMLHLVENNPEDIELVTKMLKKFNSQSGEMRFGSYTFGPIVMRAFHQLNEPELALKLFNDPEFALFFNQLTSYQILLDLLYCNNKHCEMRKTYDTIKQRLTDGRAHPRNSLILVTAGCYKENSKESLKWALDLWHELDRRGYPPVRRVLTHLAALAIRQEQPNIALEILANGKNPRYIGIRCLKIIAFANIDRLNDIVPFFRRSLETDDPNVRAESYFKDAIDKVEDAITRNKIGPDAEIVKLLQLIKSSNLVQSETLEDHIDTEVHVIPPIHSRDGSDFRNHQTHVDANGPTFIRRPGLRDLV